MVYDDSLGADTAGELANILAPGSGPLVKRAVTAIRGEWSRSRREAFKAAEQSAGLSPEDFLQHITGPALAGYGAITMKDALAETITCAGR